MNRRMVIPAVVVMAAAAATPATAATFKVRPAKFQKGMTLVDWGPNGYPESAMRERLDYLKRIKVNSVTLIQTWTQANGGATSIYPGGAAVKDDNLIAAIRYARSIGLSVLLRPYIDPADGSWRGRILVSSRNRAAWFASYGDFVLRYAALAKQEGVGIFVLASEMGQMSRTYPADWSALAARVRAVFPGPVSYEANWGEITSVKWLSSLDLIGVSAYNPICQRPTSSVAALVNSWTARLVQPYKAASARFRRPIFFSEIGYRPIARSCLQPWNTDWLAPLDTTAQRSLYEAALQVWWKQPSWFRGLHWWAMGARGIRKAPEDHDPRDPALASMATWFGHRAAGE